MSKKQPTRVSNFLPVAPTSCRPEKSLESSPSRLTSVALGEYSTATLKKHLISIPNQFSPDLKAYSYKGIEIHQKPKTHEFNFRWMIVGKGLRTNGRSLSASIHVVEAYLSEHKRISAEEALFVDQSVDPEFTWFGDGVRLS